MQAEVPTPSRRGLPVGRENCPCLHPALPPPSWGTSQLAGREVALRPKAHCEGEVLTAEPAPGCHGEPVNRVLNRPLRRAVIVCCTTASLGTSGPGPSTADRLPAGQGSPRTASHPCATPACDLEPHKQYAGSLDPAVLPPEGSALEGCPIGFSRLSACPRHVQWGLFVPFAG